MNIDSDIEKHQTKPGLLGRAASLRNKPVRPDNSKKSPESGLTIEEFDNETSDSLHSSFIKQLNELNDGLELPSRLFDLLKGKLEIYRGALLLLDTSGVFFVPLANYGLDKTTLHRLRLTEDFIKSLQSDFSSPVFLTGNDILGFKTFFSMRTFDSLEKVTLFPLFHEKELLGIILILESDIDKDNLILEILENLSPHITNVLANSRFFKLNRPSETGPASKENISKIIDKRIEDTLSRNNKLTLILLDLSIVTKFLEERSPGIELFRARNDIISILNTMVEGLGEVHNIDSSRVLLIISSKTQLKDIILMNQIKLSLQSFFQHREDFPELTAIIKRIPDDGMDSGIILDEII